jgi:hypothetical protein
MVNLAMEPPVPVSPRMASSFEQENKRTSANDRIMFDFLFIRK